MDPKIQAVIMALGVLRAALERAGAASTSGWMRALHAAVEAAYTAVTVETAIANVGGGNG